MITLEQTMADQKDLDALCKDRPLHTDEIFRANAYYGNNQIIREYAGWDAPIKGIVPHGIASNLQDNWVWVAEMRVRLPVVFCTNQFRAAVYKRLTNKIPLLSAAPFVYLTEQLTGSSIPPRHGTIFFPAHSTHHISVQMDYEAIADRLDALDRSYRPITVCMYWRDYNLGLHVPFAKRGYSVVSAGHMFDPLFLWRLYHLCSMHYYASSNEIGSSLFYSVKSGCSFFLMNDESISKTKHSKVDLPSGPSNSRYVRLKKLFSVPVAAITDEQQTEVEYYLGTAFMDTPKGYRNKLHLAERMDWSFVYTTQAGKLRIVVPSRLHRWIVNRTGRSRTLVKKLLYTIRGFSV